MRNVKETFGRMLVLALLLTVSAAAWAQQRISGTVRDGKGEALIGVSVKQAGTQNGVTTNVDGQFTLTVPQGANLEFTYIGYNSQTLRAQNGMVVTMREDNQLLDEVVVVGYGTMRRKDVTSSITTVKADDLNKGVYTTPAELLQGKVPGLTITNTNDPNGSGSISLRGASTLRTEAMEPYYVVDGVPGVDLSLVSPDDIESIDVLRDASATAIYGSKAANGVIIVTTKKGNKTGVTNVGYNGYVAFDNTLKTLDMMSASELISYAKANGVNLANADNPANTDWQDEVLRTGISHNHNVSINGGFGKTSYSASINYMNRKGVVRGTDMDRLNARTFLQTSILKDHLDLSISVNASSGTFNTVAMSYDGNHAGQSLIEQMYTYSPLVPVRNADGSWYENTTISQNFNPMSLIAEDQYTGKHKMMQGVGQATLHIVKGLDWNVTLSYQNRQNISNTYHSSKTQLTNLHSNGEATRSTTEDIKKQLETYVNWQHTFADVHNVGLMAGYSWEQDDNNDRFGLTAFDFYNDDLKYYNLGMANQLDINGIIASPMSSLRMISVYGRLNYSFDSRYILQGTLRRDGSSAFGKNNRWGTFPSASAAWRISEEKFMKDQDVVSDLKLRVGYGVSGNSLGFDAYTALQTYGSMGWFPHVDPLTGESTEYRILAADHNANPKLKWERTSMFNVGLDFGFLKNRINGTIEYYDKRTKDLIYGYSVPLSRYPYGTMDANVGDISNKGIEFTLNIVPVRTKSFEWSTTLNLSHNTNKVEKLSNSTFSVDYIDQANPDVPGGNNSQTVQRIMEGAPIGQFYLWEWNGYDSEGKSLFNDYDEDGNLVGTTDSPNDTDKRKHGSAQPKLTLGWNNTFTYKNWSLTAFFQGMFGHKIYNATRNYYNAVSLVNTGKNVLAEVPDIQRYSDTRAQMPSDRYLENGNFFRLASLSLSYTFKNLNGWAKNIRVYANCNNVFTITGYKGIDPEVYMGGLAPGIDWRNTRYPRTRTFMVGMNINFDSKGEAPTAKTVYVTDNAEVERLNAELNRLRDEYESIKNIKPDNVRLIHDTQTVTFPYLVNFTIGQSEVVNREKVNLETVAQMIKATPDKKYSVYGYADQLTGSEERNAQLSQERSQNVYDILVNQYGVPAKQLVKAAKGGVDVMYLNDPQLSRSVIISEVK